MQPRVIDPRSVARRVDQAMGGVYDSENEKSIEDCKMYGGIYKKSKGCRQGTLSCNTYDSSMDTFEQMYSGDDHDEDDPDDEVIADSKVHIWKLWEIRCYFNYT